MDKFVSDMLGNAISIVASNVSDTILAGILLGSQAAEPKALTATSVLRKGVAQSFREARQRMKRDRLDRAWARPGRRPHGKQILEPLPDLSPESQAYFRFLDEEEAARRRASTLRRDEGRAARQQEMVTAIPRKGPSPNLGGTPENIDGYGLSSYERQIIKDEETIEYQVHVAGVLRLLGMFDMLDHLVDFSATRPSIRELRARMFRFTVLADQTGESLLAPDWFRADAIILALKQKKEALLRMQRGRAVKPVTTLQAIDAAILLFSEDADRLAYCWKRDADNGEVVTNDRTLKLWKRR